MGERITGGGYTGVCTGMMSVCLGSGRLGI